MRSNLIAGVVTAGMLGGALLLAQAPAIPTNPQIVNGSGGGPVNPIAAARRADWSQAGVIGGIPARTTICATLNAGASTAAIQSAINNCPSGQAVKLNAGTYTLTGWLEMKSGVTLRGAGADATLLVKGSGSFTCAGLGGVICMRGSWGDPSPGRQEQFATWTAGYARGTTSITLSNSLGIVANNTALNLDQRDTPTDNGNIWACTGDDGPCGTEGANSAGYARTDHNCTTAAMCAQQEQVLVTGCAPSCNNAGSTVVTIAPALVWPNWSASKSPGAWWASTTAQGMGVEDLSINNGSAGERSVFMMNCNGCFVKGIRSLIGARDHVTLFSCLHCTVRDSYFYENTNHTDQSYGIELAPSSSWDLIENNIFQDVTDSTPNNNGGGVGTVAAYNFAIHTRFSLQAGWFQVADYEHAGGYGFWLREGNDTIGLNADGVHGTHYFTTIFRTRYAGWQQDCEGTPCTQQTNAFQLWGASRYFNLVGNVLGTSTRHTNYQCLAANNFDCTQAVANNTIYVLGFSRAQGDYYSGSSYCTTETCAGHANEDLLTPLTLFRWGNWDTVTSTNDNGTNDATGTRWASSEVPSATVNYPNPVPSSQALPPSMYLSAKPSFFQSRPWPGIGPDVTGGDIANTGGHANRNPARVCFEDVMHGTFTSSVLTFNRVSCYGGG